jgi:hypothetical protein
MKFCYVVIFTNDYLPDVILATLPCNITGHYTIAKVVSVSSKALGPIYICCEGTKEQRRLCFNWWWLSFAAYN